MERWPSGRRRTPGARVGVKASRVRIPISPPLSDLNQPKGWFFYSLNEFGI